MAELDLLNAFWKHCEDDARDRPMVGLIKRAVPFTLDRDATTLVVNLSSGPTLQDKLGLYRKLARLPYPVVWIEVDYRDRHEARVALGTISHLTEYDEGDMPIRMGWLIEQVDETTWRAYTVVQVLDKERRRVTNCFSMVQVLSTEGDVRYESMVKDPQMRAWQTGLIHDETVGGTMWGFYDNEKSCPSLPPYLLRANTIDLAPGWEYRVNRVQDPAKKREVFERLTDDGATELRGDLRFLCAALSTINEVPLTFREVTAQGSLRAGGRIRPYKVNRVVSIALPKAGKAVKQVLKCFKDAERRMKRHAVRGHWKRVRQGDGTVQRKWIAPYERGDSALGWVDHVYDVTGAG